MKAKFVNESIIPNAVANIILDVAEMIQEILNLDHSPIKDVRYNSKFHRYEGIIGHTGELTLDDMELIRYVISQEFPKYQENIGIQYDRNTDGLIISLDA